MADRLIQICLDIQGDEDITEREMAEFTRQLQREVLKVDVESADLPSGERSLPAGAKAADPVTWGVILVTLASSGTFGTLATILYSWVTRNKQVSVSVEIDGHKLELTGVTPEERQRLIDLWHEHIETDNGDE
jgi:hypothetical protein